MVEELPVSVVEVSADEVDVDLEVLPGAEPELPLDDDLAGGRCEDDEEGPEQVEDRQRGEEAEPEPHEHVDLLVDNIDRQHTLRRKKNII